MKGETVYVLSEKPLVLTGSFGTARNVGHLPGPFTFLYHNPGWVRPKSLWRWWLMARAFDGRLKRIIFVTNEESEVRWLRLLRIPAVCLGHNLHVRDGFFRPRVDSSRDYDAVYTARLAPQKRLHLAADIRSLCIVTYTMGVGGWDLALAEPSVAHATWNKHYLSDVEVRDCYQRSACGLALSASEGAMWACAEYLCCDLPVVSTPSRGGRDRYFDRGYVKVVAPDAQAVAEAVSQWTVQRPVRGAIRSAVLSKIRADRLAFLSLLRDRCSVSLADLDEELERFWGGEEGIARHGIPVADLPALART